MGWFDYFELVSRVDDYGIGPYEFQGFKGNDVRKVEVIEAVIPPDFPVFDKSVTGNMQLLFKWNEETYVLSFYVKEGKVEDIYDWYIYTGDNL